MSDDSKGLAGLVVGQTSISTIDLEGKNLIYRGYSVNDLAKHCDFEEVVHLLMLGTLPAEEEFMLYKKIFNEGLSLPSGIKGLLENLPSTAHPMDVLRTVCSALGCIEPENESRGERNIATRLIPFLMSSLCYWKHFSSNGTKISSQLPEKSLAYYFLYMLRQEEPSQEEVDTLNLSFILYAEHEFNASTFASRVCMATGNEFYGPITAAIATLRGNLHGGANEAAINMILKLMQASDVEEEVKLMISKKEKIMGFGHRMYKYGDPRSAILKEYVQKLIKTDEQRKMFTVAETVERVMVGEKNIHPNVDFYSALVYYFLNVPIEMYTALFVFARTSGWCAHIMEQRKDNKLIRPQGEYVGPTSQNFVPLKSRK